MGIARPYHFFRDDLYWFYKLGLQDCNVLKTPMFFKTKEMKNIVQEERLGIRPALLCNADSFDSQIDLSKNIIVAQALASKELLIGGGGQKKCIA